MAPYEPEQDTSEAADLRAGRRKAARYVVPVAVAGVAAATIGLVPALATSGDPDLPKVTAQELIEKIAASDTQQLSGTVKISTDLGLPSFGGTGGRLRSGGRRLAAAGRRGQGLGRRPAVQAHGAGVRHAHAARRRRRPRQAEAVRPGGRGRVQRDPQRRRRVGVRQRVERGVPLQGARARAAPRSGTARAAGTSPRGSRPRPRSSPRKALKAADDTTSVTVDGTAQVAGRDAYRLVIKPKQSGSTVGQITVAVDAKTGTPLKFTLTPAGGGSAVVDAGFTKVDFGKPAASTFDFTPPKGAKVTEADDAEAAKRRDSRTKAGKGDKGGKEFGEGDLNG